MKNREVERGERWKNTEIKRKEWRDKQLESGRQMERRKNVELER